MVALMMSAAVTAQNTQEWQTSTLQGSGSAYAPQVTAVGATEATSEATTTQSYAPARIPKRGGFDTGGDSGQGPSPIGDAVWPLMAMLAVYVISRSRDHVTTKKN